MKRLLAMVVCLAALSGCAVGSYRGIRVAEAGKWEFTPYVGFTDIVGVKTAYGISERSELELGISAAFHTSSGGAAAKVGGKYLILDEKTSDDFISLAMHSSINVLLTTSFPRSVLDSTLDLDLIGGKTFGKYTKDSLPGNIYLGLGSKIHPSGVSLQYRSSDTILVRIFLGSEIPFGTKFMLTPELALMSRSTLYYTSFAPIVIPNIGVGFTFR
jgi:hypothetical protein